MTSHRRVKDIAYDDDELYSDDDPAAVEEEQGYTEDDKRNFADLTPVVQAHLSEADVQVSNTQIEEALWHYYWDVAKSVDYLKKQHAPKTQQVQKQPKAKSKFDQAAEKNAVTNGKFNLLYHEPQAHFNNLQRQVNGNMEPRLTEDQDLPLSSVPMECWFDNISWHDVPEHLVGDLRPMTVPRPQPKLLGGSSKLAKLAEERRKKAEAAKGGVQDRTNEASVTSILNSLDRLTLNKAEKRPSDATTSQARKYPARKKRDVTPPPAAEPETVVEAKEDLPDLKATVSAFGRVLSAKSNRTAEYQSMSVEDVFGNSGAQNAFQGPSPDDVVLKAHGQRAPKSTNGTTSKAQASKTTAQTTAAAPVLKPKAQLPDAKALWEKARTSQRPFASFVVAGHVDHGKSTLMGRLLLDTGAVQQRDIDKFRKQAAEIGKESFALAWVMDTGSEERERGVTVDIAQHNFSTDKADFTILDAPGHRDFVPSMISGASMADILVLVVDANQLESGIKGQTREHVQLAYGVGIRKVIVAVNKLDAANSPWDQRLFGDVKDQITRLLRQVGFVERNMLFVPLSGLNGENVAKAAPKDSPAAKLTGGASSLVDALQTFTHDDASRYAQDSSSATTQATALTSRPLRMQVADVYRGGIQNPLSVSGRIAFGDVVEGQTVTILPSGDQALVKGIEHAGESTEWAVALQIVALHLDGDLETLNRNLRTGDLMCSSTQPAKLVKTITAKVQVLDTILPQAVELHFGRLHAAASIRRLLESLDGKGERLKKNPRSLKSGQVGRIEVLLDDSAALEARDRIILRSDGSTIAFGIIETVTS